QQLTWQVRRTTATPDTTAVGSDYHQRVRYEVGENGTRMVYQVFMEEPDLGSAPLVWKLRQELVITSASWGGEPPTWSRQGDEELVALELADGAATTPATSEPIEIEAWCPTLLGEAWELPTLAPQVGYWMHGHVTLAVAPELQIEDLSSSSLRQANGVAEG